MSDAEDDEPHEDHYALLVKAWEQKVFPIIRRRFRNEAERKDGLEQIKGALQLGQSGDDLDLARHALLHFRQTTNSACLIPSLLLQVWWTLHDRRWSFCTRRMAACHVTFTFPPLMTSKKSWPSSPSSACAKVGLLVLCPDTQQCSLRVTLYDHSSRCVVERSCYYDKPSSNAPACRLFKLNQVCWVNV